MKRVICLYRVSTKGQVDKDDIPMQRINYGMTHRLDALFGMLPTSIQDEFIKQVGMADFTTLLGQCGSAFEEFRYLHENVFAAGKYNLKF